MSRAAHMFVLCLALFTACVLTPASGSHCLRPTGVLDEHGGDQGALQPTVECPSPRTIVRRHVRVLQPTLQCAISSPDETPAVVRVTGEGSEWIDACIGAVAGLGIALLAMAGFARVRSSVSRSLVESHDERRSAARLNCPASGSREVPSSSRARSTPCNQPCDSGARQRLRHLQARDEHG